MNIAVCIKQVPGTASVKIDPETKRLLRDGIVSVLNPYDYTALEEAMRLKEIYGASITVITMVPPKAVDVLREALAFGANHAILLSDRKFAGSDTWGTSYILALAIKKAGAFDLVLCGKQAVDGDTAQVGPGIAAHLTDCPHCASVSEIKGIDETALSIKRINESGFDELILRLPAVLSLSKDLNTPRVPSLKGWLKALEEPLCIWGASDLNADESLIGLKGSPTRVVSTASPEYKKRQAKVFSGYEKESAHKLLRELRLVSAV